MIKWFEARTITVNIENNHNLTKNLHQEQRKAVLRGTEYKRLLGVYLVSVSAPFHNNIQSAHFCSCYQPTWEQFHSLSFNVVCLCVFGLLVDFLLSFTVSVFRNQGVRQYISVISEVEIYKFAQICSLLLYHNLFRQEMATRWGIVGCGNFN